MKRATMTETNQFSVLPNSMLYEWGRFQSFYMFVNLSNQFRIRNSFDEGTTSVKSNEAALPRFSNYNRCLLHFLNQQLTFILEEEKM